MYLRSPHGFRDGLNSRVVGVRCPLELLPLLSREFLCAVAARPAPAPSWSQDGVDGQHDARFVLPQRRVSSAANCHGSSAANCL